MLEEVDASTAEGKIAVMGQIVKDMDVVLKHSGDGSLLELSALACNYWSRKADELARWTVLLEKEHPERRVL